MAKSSKERVMAKMGMMAPPMIEEPKNRGSIVLHWEKKIVDGKHVIAYSCEHGYGGYDDKKKEFTDKAEFLSYVEDKINAIPGDKGAKEKHEAAEKY